MNITTNYKLFNSDKEEINKMQESDKIEKLKRCRETEKKIINEEISNTNSEYGINKEDIINDTRSMDTENNNNHNHIKENTRNNHIKENASSMNNHIKENTSIINNHIKENASIMNNHIKENTRNNHIKENTSIINNHIKENTSSMNNHIKENTRNNHIKENSNVHGSKFNPESSTLENPNNGFSYSFLETNNGSAKKNYNSITDSVSVKCEPSNLSLEVINHLTSRIKLQDAQISSYQKAMEEKEQQIAMLEEKCQLLEGGCDCKMEREYVRDRAIRGLQIVETLLKQKKPSDLSEELRRERLKNISYKTIIEGLTETIKNLEKKDL